MSNSTVKFHTIQNVQVPGIVKTLNTKPMPSLHFSKNNYMKLSLLNTSLKMEENICSKHVIMIMMDLLTIVNYLNVLKKLNNNGELIWILSDYVEKLPVLVLLKS
jgi:hypothetical protein